MAQAVVTGRAQMRQDQRWHADGRHLAFRRWLWPRATGLVQGCRPIRAAPGHGNALARPAGHRFGSALPALRPQWVQAPQTRAAARVLPPVSGPNMPPMAARPAPRAGRKGDGRHAFVMTDRSDSVCRGDAAPNCRQSDHLFSHGRDGGRHITRKSAAVRLARLASVANCTCAPTPDPSASKARLPVA